MHATSDSLLLPATPNDPPDRLSEQQKTRSYIGLIEEKPLVLSMLLAWISPLFLTASAVPEESSFTLNDLVQPHTYQRLFDTLSASVASEYEGKVISFDESKVIEYDAPTFSIKKLNEKYSSVLYESDMVIHPERLKEIVESSIDTRNGRRIRKRKAFVDYMYPRTIWTTGVPYSIHHSVVGLARQNVVRAIAFWQAETCIDFRPRTTEKQFVEFIGNDEGCWSTVGKDDALGRQVVSIGRGCEHFGVTSHELAHSLGVFHEQSRYDRDGVVQLNKNVVAPTLLFNFAKISPRELNTYRLPYDVGSVMHYTPTEFSSYKSIPALTTVDPNLQQSMGQMEGPSFLDVMVLNLHYNCQGVSILYVFLKTQQQIVFEAPKGKRVLVNIVRVQGRCVEGCWEDGVEFKMTSDPRPVGYRFCCQPRYQRRIVSRTNVVPFIVTSRNVGITLTFEYTFVDANAHYDFDEEEALTTPAPAEVTEAVGIQSDGVNTTIAKVL
ncbi:astacin [Ancylostoma caninum]|uniref:Metalloendopeptidase n=1 Tax=Ancylostoma caninum TaxID=29170 RepID=A0A368G723_ANCCA|nr:astacin [Ancylostoma caninum]